MPEDDGPVQFWDPKNLEVVARPDMVEIDRLEPDQHRPVVGSNWIEQRSNELLAEGAFSSEATDEQQSRVESIAGQALERELLESMNTSPSVEN